MSVESFLGPLEIAVLVSCVIFGVTCLQCCIYYIEHSTNDPGLLKSLVAVLMGLEALHTALISHTLYIYSIKVASKDASNSVLWSFLAQVIVSGFLSAITQCFFAIRIYYLNDHHLLTPLAITSVTAVMLITTLSIAIKGYIRPFPFSSMQSGIFSHIGSVRMLLTSICDVTITISTIHYLRRTRTPIASTNRVINKLIIYTLNTGLLTTIFALITGVVFLAQKAPFTYTPFYFVMTRLYTCSLISILNSRTAMQEQLANAARGTGASDAIFTSIGFDLTVRPASCNDSGQTCSP